VFPLTVDLEAIDSQTTRVMMPMPSLLSEYDYIIVGAGGGGCPAGHRLSAESGRSTCCCWSGFSAVGIISSWIAYSGWLPVLSAIVKPAFYRAWCYKNRTRSPALKLTLSLGLLRACGSVWR